MDRLTERDGVNAYYKTCFEHPEHNGETCPYMETKKCAACEYTVGSCEKLAQYEDTELCPNDVELLKKMYDGVVRQRDEIKSKQEQGLLVELPCKVGDTVYRIFNGKIKSNLVEMIGVYKTGYMLTLGRTVWASCSDIGKTIFLTKEAAEKALRR